MVRAPRLRVFDLPFRPPYRWSELMAFLAPRATPGLESVEAGVYRRSIALDGNEGWFDVTLAASKRSLSARVSFSDAASIALIVDRIRRMFDVDTDWRPIGNVLRSDPKMKVRVDAAPGLRVPGCWDPFEMTVRAIIGQQVSVKAATTIAGRIVRDFGRPAPHALADADLSRVGLTTKRAATIRDLARAVLDGAVRFDAPVDEFRARLCEIGGIGNWTAQYVAMRALADRDAFPSGDLGLLHALDLRNAKELDRRAEAWRPWRSYATMYLWL